jgi:hypothetical protein
MAVNYTDADEDAEKLMSFLDEVSFLQTSDSKATISLHTGGRSPWTGRKDKVRRRRLGSNAYRAK